MSKKEELAVLLDLAKQINYGRVHLCMRALGWRYRGAGTPTKDELGKIVAGLCGNMAGDESCVAVDTGGFEVRRLGKGQFRIAFNIEDVDNID